MIEYEAKTKGCPMFRNDSLEHNRTRTTNLRGNCIASDCAVWVKESSRPEYGY